MECSFSIIYCRCQILIIAGMPNHGRKRLEEKETGRYSRAALASAVGDVFNGKMDIHKASSKYGPSVRTINRHLK